MGATPIYALPYPEPADPADVPADLKELAERTELILGGALSPTPPVSPVGGQLWATHADDSQGIVWVFRYNAASTSPYKWEFVGGSDVLAGPQGLASGYAGTGYAELGSGPRVTIPHSGDYLVEHGCHAANVGSGFTGTYFFNIDAPGSVAGGTVPLNWGIGVAWQAGYGSIANLRTGLTAGEYLSIAGQADRAGTATDFGPAWLKVRPVRVA